MLQKLFPLDKNYILKEAQIATEQGLLIQTVEEVKRSYLLFCNPLGLEDDAVLKIKNQKKYRTVHLKDFYENLAGIYRYKFGSNQLELLFDGKNHFEKYQEDWSGVFMQWIEDFCRDENFLKAILEVTIFYPEGRKALLAGNRLKAYISQYLSMKVYKYRGIVPLKISK